MTPGSSPLARGLLAHVTSFSVRRRIIPARAGFTGIAKGTYGLRGDHPRSRGVYDRTGAPPPIYYGSSPLARGLLPIIEHTESRQRIIPARAGFTGAAEGAGPRRADHPRSRGVYNPQAAPTEKNAGSSPLARGLPRSRPSSAARQRIIPARAGFTSRRPGTHRHAWDHPRSRGVYPGYGQRLCDPGGSSPLARGLQDSPLCGGEAERIISARAGFTGASPCGACRDRDHPRSRGVYAHHRAAIRPAEGSSPLARGLRPGQVDLPDRLGIIPARAGFTTAESPPSALSADHPRSRGVYCPGTAGIST